MIYPLGSEHLRSHDLLHKNDTLGYQVHLSTINGITCIALCSLVISKLQTHQSALQDREPSPDFLNPSQSAATLAIPYMDSQIKLKLLNL